MNNKGFTLVELLAVIVILSIIAGITVVSVMGVFKNAKDKTEDVLVETIRDALDIYLSSDAKGLVFSSECSNALVKSQSNVKVYKVITNFEAVINSSYHPISQNDLVNPANKDVDCADASDIEINIYRDEDYVYYYSIDKSEFNKTVGVNFFLNTSDSVISNLPEGFSC